MSPSSQGTSLIITHQKCDDIGGCACGNDVNEVNVFVQLIRLNVKLYTIVKIKNTTFYVILIPVCINVCMYALL